MLRKKSLQSSLFPWTLTPTTTPELSPTSSSDSDSDEDMESRPGSRPHSLAVSTGTINQIRPTLDEVLANAAPAPYTLSAFMAYLSQNHCLETLEFTLEATRYRETYESLMQQFGRPPSNAHSPEYQHLCMLWQRLLTAYVLPGAPREVNLSGEVRNNLLQYASVSFPPAPETLDPAVKLIHELMEESIFIPFLNSCAAVLKENCSFSESPFDDDETMMINGGLDENVVSRIRSRRKDLASSFSQGTYSGRSHSSVGPVTSLGKFNTRTSGHASMASGDSSATLTDDSGSYSSAGEPMTPPTTPPSSDVRFESAASSKPRSDNPFRKMGFKLGFKRRSATDAAKERDPRIPGSEDCC